MKINLDLDKKIINNEDTNYIIEENDNNIIEDTNYIIEENDNNIIEDINNIIEDTNYIIEENDNDIIEDNEIDESILKLVYEKNLEKNDSLLDLELNNHIDNTKKNKKHKNKIRYNISLQELHKNPINNEKTNIIRKFNPRLPPYFLIKKNNDKKIEKIF
uniref:Uncharacterized protein n=1 Tax=viral metagenome TaxID=1070528 RepID=A0A6C0EBV3_9ZZZZ